LRAIKAQPFGSLSADTIYFGGGTPSLLGSSRLVRILDKLAARFDIAAGAEITLEANPGTVDGDSLRELRSFGFTRLSIGVQSLVSGELAHLGRIHTSDQAEQAIENARTAGFSDISADVMLGIPNQNKDSLSKTLERLLSLPLNHLSAYILKIEEGTPFALRNIEDVCPGEDESSELYLHCADILSKSGFSHYEISNFAKGGAEGRHNLKYWRCEEYLGIGPSAHSFISGRRFYFPRSLMEFCKTPNPWDLRIDDGEGGSFEEYAMLRLRLSEGINDKSIASKALPLAKIGLVNIFGDTVSLTAKGWLLSNAVTARLLL